MKRQKPTVITQAVKIVNIPQPFTKWQWMTCECGDSYQLGKTGTIYGCDRCQGITRNPIDGTVIPDPFKSIFGKEG